MFDAVVQMRKKQVNGNRLWTDPVDSIPQVVDVLPG